MRRGHARHPWVTCRRFELLRHLRGHSVATGWHTIHHVATPHAGLSSAVHHAACVHAAHAWHAGHALWCGEQARAVTHPSPAASATPHATPHASASAPAPAPAHAADGA